MCKHFYDFGNLWICFDCKIIGLRIAGRDFQIEFSRKHLIRIKEYPRWNVEKINKQSSKSSERIVITIDVP